MTEASLLWDSGGGGDASPHSEALTAKLFAAVFGATSANKGVIRGMLNELAPSISGTNILMNTGYAIVDGHPYYNDASKSTAITTPGAGTTGRRLVLRCSWSAQTVRATIITSADGTATIPAMTQTPGTTYDIPIASFTTTTGGVSTITADDREYAGSAPSLYDVLLPGISNAATGIRKGFLYEPGTTLAPTPSVVGIGLNYVDVGGNGIQVPSSITDSTKSMAKLQTTTTSNDDAMISRYQWGCDPATDAFEMSCVISLDNAVSRNFFFGICNSQTPGDANNRLGFRVIDNGNIIAFTDAGGVETSQDTGLAGSAAPGTVYALRIVGSGGTVRWMVNGTTVLTTSSNLPTQANAPWFLFGLRTTAAAQKDLHYRDIIAYMQAA